MKTALYDIKGVFIREYNSISELAKYLEINTSTLSRSIKRGWKLRGVYYAKTYDDTYKESIPISNYKLGKELRCFKLIRGKLTFYKKFRNLTEAADFVKMNHRTFTRRIKNGLLIEHRKKTYRFRFIHKEDAENHMHNHRTYKSLGINYGSVEVPIKLIDKYENEFLFNSIGAAVRELDLNRVAILHVLAGRQKTTFGFKVERLTET